MISAMQIINFFFKYPQKKRVSQYVKELFQLKIES